jgi:hypothetical protein
MNCISWDMSTKIYPDEIRKIIDEHNGDVTVVGHKYEGSSKYDIKKIVVYNEDHSPLRSGEINIISYIASISRLPMWKDEITVYYSNFYDIVDSRSLINHYLYHEWVDDVARERLIKEQGYGR